MILKINSMYQVSGGHIVPRSHFKKEKGVQYAIIERLDKTAAGYVMRHVTMTRQEIKKALGLAKNEKMEIV